MRYGREGKIGENDEKGKDINDGNAAAEIVSIMPSDHLD